MSKYQAAKTIVRNYFEAMENANPETVADVLKEFTADDYLWRGVYPFREQRGADVVAETFWAPLMQSLTRMQRRQDIFIAGTNEIRGEQWVMSMGNFMGLFDADWLGIGHTRKIANLRYAEFNCVENGKISQTGLFLDIIGLMVQAGAYPLPPSTGVYFNYPGPRTHDGLLFEDAPEEEGAVTQALVNTMIGDLVELNETGSMDCPPEVLERSWSDEMIWYGPAGIGSTRGIDGFQQFHQGPFLEAFPDREVGHHDARLAEGNYCASTGWPAVVGTHLGDGWLGLPATGNHVDMRVIDVWRRCGLVVPWNDPHVDIQRKLERRDDLFLVAVDDGEVVGTVMAGYEGHRGWLNYLAVHPARRGEGLGRALVEQAERRLRALGCPKINLQIRTSNREVAEFYRALGFSVDDVISMGKRLSP